MNNNFYRTVIASKIADADEVMLFGINESKLLIVDTDSMRVLLDKEVLWDGTDTRLDFSYPYNYIVSADYYKGMTAYNLNGDTVWISKTLKKVDDLQILGSDYIVIERNDCAFILDIKTGDIINKVSKVTNVAAIGGTEDCLLEVKGLNRIYSCKSESFIDNFHFNVDGWKPLCASANLGTFVCGVNNGFIHAFNTESGEKLWTYHCGENVSPRAITNYTLNGIVCAYLRPIGRGNGNVNSYILLFDLLTGNVLSKFDLDMSMTASFIGKSNQIITNRGNVYNIANGSLVKSCVIDALIF